MFHKGSWVSLKGRRFSFQTILTIKYLGFYLNNNKTKTHRKHFPWRGKNETKHSYSVKISKIRHTSKTMKPLSANGLSLWVSDVPDPSCMSWCSHVERLPFSKGTMCDTSAIPCVLTKKSHGILAFNSSTHQPFFFFFSFL